MDEYITYYLGMGLCLIPAFPCSKRPCVEWKKYQFSKPSEDEIRLWRDMFWRNGYNIGCISGGVSNNLAVLDIDSETMSRTFDVDMFASETMVVRTGGGGYHVYFRTPKPVRTVKFLDESKRVAVELRGEGSFNILPPSTHPETGQQYVLLSRPDTLITIKNPVEDLSKILGVKPTYDTAGPEPVRRYKKLDYEPPCIRRLLDPGTKIKEGWRNEALIRVTSYFMQTEFDEEGDMAVDLKIKAHAWNLAHCEPPLDWREVENVVKSVLKHRYSYGCRGLSPVCTGAEKSKCRLYAQFLKAFREKMEVVKCEVE